MRVLCFILFLTYFCSTENEHIIRVPRQNRTSQRIDFEEDNISLNEFVDILIIINLKQLNNTKLNIIKNYELGKPEVDLIDYEFRLSHLELQIILLSKLQTFINVAKYVESETFKIAVLELSNSVFQNIIRNNLENIGGKLLELSEWEEQSLKDKIARQQCKIAVHVMEGYVCDTVNLCYDKIYYTEYLTYWFKQLMSTRAYNMKEFFSTISEYIESNILTFKTNVHFRKRIKDIIKGNFRYQSDIIDFIDEIITSGNATLKNILPIKLKKISYFLVQLVQLVDSNYDLNIENINILKDIHLKFVHWTNKGDIDLESILTTAIQNMQLNIRIWPLNVQAKIDFVWSKIIKY